MRKSFPTARSGRGPPPLPGTSRGQLAASSDMQRHREERPGCPRCSVQLAHADAHIQAILLLPALLARVVVVIVDELHHLVVLAGLPGLQ